MSASVVTTHPAIVASRLHSPRARRYERRPGGCAERTRVRMVAHINHAPIVGPRADDYRVKSVMKGVSSRSCLDRFGKELGRPARGTNISARSAPRDCRPGSTLSRLDQGRALVLRFVKGEA